MQKHYLCGSWWWDTQEQRFSSSKLKDWLQTWELTDNCPWSVVCSWACVGRYWWLTFLKSLWLVTSWTNLFLQRGSADPNFVALVESPAEKPTSSLTFVRCCLKQQPCLSPAFDWKLVWTIHLIAFRCILYQVSRCAQLPCAPPFGPPLCCGMPDSWIYKWQMDTNG